MTMQKRLYLSSDKKLVGVCGGIAEYFDIDPTIVRVLYVLLTFFSAAFPGLLIYIILACIIPHKPTIQQ
ncbi:MAG: PspC domain-containing protein [Paludibacteraceae bacterium]|nr:PspC domain-containing protein [Paludibacteraceae bacterium]